MGAFAGHVRVDRDRVAAAPVCLMEIELPEPGLEGFIVLPARQGTSQRFLSGPSGTWESQSVQQSAHLGAGRAGRAAEEHKDPLVVLPAALVRAQPAIEQFAPPAPPPRSYAVRHSVPGKPSPWLRPLMADRLHQEVHAGVLRPPAESLRARVADVRLNHVSWVVLALGAEHQLDLICA